MNFLEMAGIFILGMFIALLILSRDSKVTIINGTNSGHMTVDYKYKTYDLVERK